jgi:hypothetical protein
VGTSVNGFVINGQAAADYSGISVANAGDVNGDGYDDLIVGASNADPAGRTDAGRYYVVFGKSGNTAVDLSSISPATGNITGNFFNGNGSALTGIDATSIQSGNSNVRVVTSAGNIAVNVTGAGIVSFTTAGIINNMGNGVGNIGNSTGYFNTVFA